MKPKAIDANIILRFVTADHPEMSPRCRALFERVQNGDETIYLPEAALADTVRTLRSTYKWSASKTAAFVQSLLHQECILMRRKALMLKSIQLLDQHNVDFSDAWIAAEISEMEINEIYSFDRDFDRFASTDRREP